MPTLKDLTNVWGNIKEIDLRPMAREAEKELVLAIVGAPFLGGAELAELLKRDPHRPEIQVSAPLILADVQADLDVSRVDAIILLLDGGSQDDSLERRLAQDWAALKKPVLVVLVQPAPWKPRQSPPTGMGHWMDWGSRRVVVGPVLDEQFLLEVAAPAMVRLLPDRLLGLARFYPLFRKAVAHQLINDTCFANSAYALSTGLAEVVPVLDIPLNITDMIVLTKAQAFLVYRLGLALGLSTRWQDYVAEFGSVLGGGFVWRQLARQLVGLIPVWGIVPKVAVSYAGTYAVGTAVLQWYLTGKHLTGKQMRQLYGQAFARGRQLAARLFKRKTSKKVKEPAALPETIQGRVCPTCTKVSALDAGFCQYCGQALVD